MFVYLDNAAATKIDEEVLREMMPYLTNEYGNPGSPNAFGRRAKLAIDNARAQVAQFLHTTPDHIIFTSSGSEANNIAINSMLYSYRNDTYLDPVVFSSTVEHESVLFAAYHTCGVVLPVIYPNDDGIVDAKSIENMSLGKLESAGISVMYSNNESGLKNDVESIIKICHKIDTPVHIDCVQAAGSYDINVNDLDCDFLSISSHKIHGPKGVGALYVKDLSKFVTNLKGGDNQEFGFIGGTENVAGIVGFGKACEIAGSKHNMDLIKENTEYLKSRIKDIFGDDASINFNGSLKTVSVRFGVDAETLLSAMSAAGVYASAGSACQNLESEPSYVLKSLGLTNEEARSTIRLSISRFTTRDEIDSAIDVIKNCVNYIKRLGEFN